MATPTNSAPVAPTRLAALGVVILGAVSWYLTGLIWTIQVVHYPLFDLVGAASFVTYEAAHTVRITAIVGPAMLLECGLALWFALVPPAIGPRWTWQLGAGLVGLIWVSTGFLQVPMHDQLARGFSTETHGALVLTNWIRTVSWTIRSLLVSRDLAGALTSWSPRGVSF